MIGDDLVLLNIERAKVRELQSENARLKEENERLREYTVNGYEQIVSELKADLEEAEKVLMEVSLADCAKHIAHPQSVRWQIHVVNKVSVYLAKRGKIET